MNIITAAQIQKEGFVTVYDMLTTLTEATGTVEAPSQWGSHTPNASGLNLRGMGPNRTLLLVNARRVADYPLPYGGETNFSNYSNIPAAAVERIEVLTGGASAIYGSDAIAGVVNVILKTHYDGDQVRVRGGTSTEGGRDTWDLSWAGGKTGDRWSVTYALQYNKRDPLFGRDRPAMDDADDAPPSSWNMEQRKVGFRPTTGLALVDNSTGRRLAPPSGTCEKFNGEYYTADRRVYNYGTNTISNTGQLCGMSADYANWMLTGGSENISGNLYGTFDFDNGLQAWSNLAVFHSEALWGANPPSVYLVDDVNGYYWDANRKAPLIGSRQFTPNEVGGLDTLRNTNRELSFDWSAGLRGRLADRFDWSANVGRSYYRVEERQNVVNKQKSYDFFLGPRLGTTADGAAIYALNKERWWNPITPEQYWQMGTVARNRASSYVNQASADITGDLLQGWAGPISFAGVVEVAKQGYQLNPDPRAGIDFDLQNVDRGGGERTRYSAGLEFKIPLLESLTATAAARYDRYGSYKASDSTDSLAIGSQKETTWNAGLEWRPFETLLVRGSYATSFHAPDMHYLLGQPSSSQVQTTDRLHCIQSGAYKINNCGVGNNDVWYTFDVNRRGTPPLRPETCDSWTVGFVWDVLPNASLTADYWVIKLEDMIVDVGSDEILSAEAGCLTGLNMDGTPWANPGGSAYWEGILSRVNRDANGRLVSIERRPFNLAQRTVKGIDVTARYRLDTAAWGNFQFSLNYTNQLSTKEQRYAADPNPERRDRDLCSKIRGSVAWQGGRWNANVFADRVGSVPGVRYHWGIDRLDNPGGCLPFADGYVPSDSPSANCSEPANLPSGAPNPNPNAGQSTSRYFGRVAPFITWNVNVGYRVTEHAKVNLYVNNVFNSASWNHKDPYKLDYDFAPTRLLSAVGREFSLEYVFDF
ncbi:MAG: Colicin I receptor [Stenotrophomonas maltophilia]|uniref:Colicin I receptor n=1 Tax=Stenotrophomonas maltophilia TaxID=40324 RepID=A0A7V8JNC3_STEMA|nr:MAG: Colicin I receptor [Stenotrophomonas maltophilia]